MPTLDRRTLLRYAIAPLAVYAGYLTLLIPSVREYNASVVLVLVLAIFASARWGGVGPGIVATALSVVTTWHWDLTEARLVRLALFLASGLLASLGLGALGDARRRAEADAERRRRAEEALRAERDLADAFLETAGGLVIVLDREGRIVRFNRGAAEATGYDAAEVLGRPFWDVFLLPREMETIREGFARLLASGGTSRRENRWRTKGGRAIHVAWSNATLADASGRVVYVIANGVDVTDRRRAGRRIARLNRELSLRVAELQAIFDVIPVGIGLAEDPDCRSIRVNDEFARLLRLDPEANASMSAPEVERPTHFRIVREGRVLSPEELPLQVAAARGEEVRDFEVDIVFDDGRSVTLLESAAPLFDGRGAVRGSVGAFLDITERKRARDELGRAKEAAEEANRAKDLFLAMLSHELRTPLTPALLAVSGLLDDPGLPPGLAEPLEAVRRGIALEARLVDDLLDAMRAGAGKLRLDLRRVDAHEAVAQAVDACRADLAAGGLGLEVDLAAAEHHAEADPARLQQAVWNLLKNAAKFTPAGGRVAVRTRNERPAADAVAGRNGDVGGPSGRTRLVVEVVDTGVGLEPEALGRIFDPFEQVGARPGRSGGLGLGLAISRAVAEAHGGRLRASSDGPGRGSTFALELPTAPAPTDPAAGPGDPPGPDRSAWPGRVLLVEDDDATARVLSRLMGRQGSAVTVAGSLAEARAALAGGRFDLVLSDVGLPDGTAWELADALRGPDSAPAVALTGLGTEDDVRRCREAGFAAHLTKPVDFARLEAVILRAVARPAGA